MHLLTFKCSEILERFVLQGLRLKCLFYFYHAHKNKAIVISSQYGRCEGRLLALSQYPVKLKERRNDKGVSRYE